jgi:hypothetical protein
MATEGGSTQGTPESFTEAEAASLAQKLQEWSATLPLREQALLSIVLSRVEETEVPSVSGFQRQVDVLSQEGIRPWLTNIATQSQFHPGVGVNYFARDVGPSWVNSPRGRFSDRILPSDSR